MQSIRRVVLALLWLSPACSGGGTSLCEENGVSVVIEDNHPDGSHILEIPTSDVLDGEDVTYDIQGDNTGHGHTVTVTSEDFTDLQDGLVVTLTSSDTGAAGQDHTHTVVLDCNP